MLTSPVTDPGVRRAFNGPFMPTKTRGFRYRQLAISPLTKAERYGPPGLKESLKFPVLHGRILPGGLAPIRSVDSPSIPRGKTNAIVVDKKGDVWFGMEPVWLDIKDSLGRTPMAGGGLVRLSGSTWTAFDTVNSRLPSNTLSSVAVDSQGVLWAGGAGGLTSFDGKSWTTYTDSNTPLPGKSVDDIEVDPAGKIWVAAGGGIAVIARTSVRSAPPEPRRGTDAPSVRVRFSANGELVISYSIATAARVRVELFDMLGRTIAVPCDRTEPAGSRELALSNDRACSRGHGAYLWRMTIGKQCFSGKAVIAR